MADTTIGTSAAIITPDLEIIDGQITTTSHQIAARFNKAHRSVLLAIRRLECSDEFRLHNFVQSSYLNEQGKEQPCYRLNRDGFVFLAMGFTGKDAVRWKEAYIAAFNKMEAKLLAQVLAQPTRPYNPAIDYDRISPAQKQDLKEIVNAIVAAKVQTYGETWARLQKKFRVNSYEELPATQHLEARAYLLAKLPKGSAADVMDRTPTRTTRRTRQPAQQMPLLPAPRRIRSRDDLSFTKRDAKGRLINWLMPERPGNWHEHYGIGEIWFNEIVELAHHNPQEAYLAMCFAGPELTRYWGHGHPDGFFHRMAQWALAAILANPAQTKPHLPIKPFDMGIAPREGMDFYLDQAAAV